MWADAQRDGRPAEYSWRPLCNAAKFGWRLILECRAVTLTRRETSRNLQGRPKLPDRSQSVVGPSSGYCGSTWRRYWCLRSFFSNCRYVPLLRRYSRQSCAMVPRWRFFDDFLRPVFGAIPVQHVSDLRLKFALRPHHVCKYGRHPICDGWD